MIKIGRVLSALITLQERMPVFLRALFFVALEAILKAFCCFPRPAFIWLQPVWN
jgi:hypothetical protein